MEPESRYEEIITRYLLNEAAPEEVKFVLEWMAANEINRLYVEELQNALHLIGLTRQVVKVDVNEEWEQLRQIITKEQSQVLHINQYVTTDDYIAVGEEQNKRTRIYKILIGAAIAASVIFMIALGAGWFSVGVAPNSGVAQQKKGRIEEAKINPLMAVVQHEVNTTGKTKQIILPDGSKIVLFDSSELTYKEPTNGKRRDVYLSGKADFTIAKNKAKPFTVFSENISTTAIGTMFTVDANKSSKVLQVKLFEGKVVVRSLKGYNEKWTGERYLVPGQELIYDKQRKAVTVTSYVIGKPVRSKAVAQAEENPSIPHYDKRSWFMFNNQSLSEVFDALTEMYDVKIIYARKDVKDMYFIGTYEKSDSLNKILKQIALLNNLKVTRQSDTFKIERQILKK